QDNKIITVGSVPADFRPDQTIDCSNHVISPGFIDVCARLREPGFTQKGTIATETKAAAASGFSAILCPPDTEPVIDSAAVANLIADKAVAAGFPNVLPIGALTKRLEGQQLANMYALKQAGCVAFSNLRRAIKDSRTLLRCLEYAATHDLIVYFQSQDPSLAEGCVSESPLSSKLGLPSIPASAETVALARDLILVEQTGVRAHFGQLSTARSVEMIANAQARGLAVTADVALHQLHITENAVEGFNSLFHVIPPLRSEKDVAALRLGIKTGVIGAICSDHQPHDAFAKMAPFAETEPGISAYDSFLPLALALVEEGVLDLAHLIERLTIGPARKFSLPMGSLNVGNRANICVFSTDQGWTMNAENMRSKGKNSPYLNARLKGKNRLTLIEGQIAFNELEQ
ncbi:MAG TPA: dihydroorotase, partial [Pseudomonadales bacterium]|nr:dihydroorotase [Pseudomonadales bacterium]